MFLISYTHDDIFKGEFYIWKRIIKTQHNNIMNTFLLKLNKLNIIVLAISSLIILTIFSCDDNDNDERDNDVYFVNYIIEEGSYGRFRNWTATTPDGTFNSNDIYNGFQTRRWDQTFAPYRKNWRCTVEIGDYTGGTPTIEIHVAKNDEPFALKEIVTGASASYTIN